VMTPMFSAMQAVSVSIPGPLGLFSSIGSGELVLILVLVLIIFGPKQLPSLARSLGKTMRGIRQATDEIREEIGVDDIDLGPLNRRGPGPVRRPGSIPPRHKIPEDSKAADSKAPGDDSTGEVATPKSETGEDKDES